MSGAVILHEALNANFNIVFAGERLNALAPCPRPADSLGVVITVLPRVAHLRSSLFTTVNPPDCEGIYFAKVPRIREWIAMFLYLLAGEIEKFIIACFAKFARDKITINQNLSLTETRILIARFEQTSRDIRFFFHLIAMIAHVCFKISSINRKSYRVIGRKQCNVSSVL